MSDTDPSGVTSRTRTCGSVLALAVVLAGCSKLEQNNPKKGAEARADAKRQQASCASSVAYDRLKSSLFDQALAGYRGDRANLDTLADYSTVRMEGPVVESRDDALDITRCKGRLILDVPPGAERGFGGERRLAADIRYTAQAAADGSGLVYQLIGAEPLVTRLAAFDVTGGAFRPPPAIDTPRGEIEVAAVPAPVREVGLVPTPAPAPVPVPDRTASVEDRVAPPPPRRPTPAPERDDVSEEPIERGSGEATVRAFYGALRAGDGQSASAQVVPEKRGGGSFSPRAMTRFYGRLPEPIQLTEVTPVAGGAYRVRYRYSAGRSRCNGSAIVRLADRGGRELIRSIQATSGC